MADIQINPTNNDWELIVDLSRSKLDTETQIPKLDLDVSLNSNFIAVEVLTSFSKPNWVAGGYIAQQYQLDEFDLTPQPNFVSINQINLIELKAIANISFSLIYSPPKYFKDVVIRVWKYRGIETDLLLQNIATALSNNPITATVDLSQVNQKLNTLISLQETGNSQKLIDEINTKLNAILPGDTAPALPGAASSIALTGTTVNSATGTPTNTNFLATRFT